MQSLIWTTHDPKRGCFEMCLVRSRHIFPSSHIPRCSQHFPTLSPGTSGQWSIAHDPVPVPKRYATRQSPSDLKMILSLSNPKQAMSLPGRILQLVDQQQQCCRLTYMYLVLPRENGGEYSGNGSEALKFLGTSMIRTHMAAKTVYVMIPVAACRQKQLSVSRKS